MFDLMDQFNSIININIYIQDFSKLMLQSRYYQSSHWELEFSEFLLNFPLHLQQKKKHLDLHNIEYVTSKDIL